MFCACFVDDTREALRDEVRGTSVSAARMWQHRHLNSCPPTAKLARVSVASRAWWWDVLRAFGANRGGLHFCPLGCGFGVGVGGGGMFEMTSLSLRSPGRSSG